MKTRIIHFNDLNLNKISAIQGLSDFSDNSRDHNRLKQIMNKTIEGELTGMQRYCLTEHYFNHKRQKQIAKELGVAPSTVSRHISKAIKKLKSIASYYN